MNNANLICPSCKVSLRPGAKFCGNCGTAGVQKVNTQSNSNGRSKDFDTTALALVATFVLSIVLGMVVNGIQTLTEPSVPSDGEINWDIVYEPTQGQFNYCLDTSNYDVNENPTCEEILLNASSGSYYEDPETEDPYIP